MKLKDEFTGLLHKVRDHKKPIRKDDDWVRYLSCDNLPDPNIPSDIRGFFFKWQMSLAEYWEQQINWLLKCNDHSVLTQDPNQPDQRRKLIQKLRDPTGRFYDQKLRSLMRVYNTLLDALRRRKMTTSQFEDLITVELFSHKA